MADGGSSSGAGGGGGGGRRGGGETLVVDQGKRRGSCGYCGSADRTSISHGMWAHSITVDDYQELLDRGWRRSGCYLYKPEMKRTCCPSYTIRLKAGSFVPTKEQSRVHKKMQRYLDGKVTMNKVECSNKKPNSPKGSVNLDVGASSSTAVTVKPGKESSDGICAKMSPEDEFIGYLSNMIDEAVRECVDSGEFPSTVELPKAIVKKVTSNSKRKLAEVSEDLLYTSNVSFQIAAVVRRSCTAEGNIGMVMSPNIVAEKLACFLEQKLEHSGLVIKACNAHLNFYSTTKQIDSFPLSGDKCIQTSKENVGECQQSCSGQNVEVLPCKRRKLEIRMKQSSFDPEEFALYRRYQIKVHNDKPEKVTESSYKHFLVDTPLVAVRSQNKQRMVPPCGFGSFHQQYVIDGKLVAVGVVDILPKCLSSKYLFWDPNLSFLSLGKYSALQEINWVKEAEVHCPSLQYYYLGYYIHSCSKMRYKAAYRPSELLCPLRYEWVPFEIARPLLERSPYAVLSDYKYHAPSSPQLPGTSTGRSSSTDKEQDDPGKSFSDEDEETDLYIEGSDSDVDNVSDSEGSLICSTDDLADADISNIMIDLRGARVKFKDLQQMFGPIEKRIIRGLEKQIQSYVGVVGPELSNRMVYSLG